MNGMHRMLDKILMITSARQRASSALFSGTWSSRGYFKFGNDATGHLGAGKSSLIGHFVWEQAAEARKIMDKIKKTL